MSNLYLQFAPFNSCITANFWHKFSKKKLEVYKLDETPIKIIGYYNNNEQLNLPCIFNLDDCSLDDIVVSLPPNSFCINGYIKNFNNIDNFKDSNKNQLVEDLAIELWKNITDESVLEYPERINTFLVVTYADLKKYHYYYWFHFMGLKILEKYELLEPVQQLEVEEISNLFSIINKFDKVPPFFAIFINDNSIIESVGLNGVSKLLEEKKIVSIVCCDPSTSLCFPGWPCRNLITVACFYWSKYISSIRIICLRDRTINGQRILSDSIKFVIQLKNISNCIKEIPTVVGWEKNERQKLGPKMVNMASSMDPKKLAESAVDLNLKLMKWRLMPYLDLTKVQTCKCLLLGAGTLGCNVARNLIGWGVRKITFVDNGKISYSNPVRQSLFTFHDSIDGGKLKAQTAAENLKLIFPGLDVNGFDLSIPMPGHPATGNCKDDVAKLENLIKNHDVVFLLMDTRESRWLPTLISSHLRKLVMNVALGFDSYLVMRHGLYTLDSSEPTLGCYFCNDIVAPGNSSRDRTLDQQCTVSRPGMSMIASALAVELLVTILQHPSGALAPPDSDPDIEIENDCLGIIPHQIRGFISKFYNIFPTSLPFDKCSACSKTVIDIYNKEGYEFLSKVFNDSEYLEQVTGLAKLQDGLCSDIEFEEFD